MDRRSLLKFGAFCWLPFGRSMRAKKTLGPYYSPFLKDLGQATNISISTVYDIERMFEQPLSYKYIKFPPEIIVDITYENGTERWSAFNMKNEGFKNFSMKKFFSSKFIPGASDYGGHFEYGGVKFQLSSILFNDDFPEKIPDLT